jgi:zinc/manganese transport system substrate-binding protein/manganese/iron transport system substrate-binding protein
MVNDIAAGLAAADPSGAAVYRANAARYRARLRALDRSLAAKIATVPAARRKLVTNHDAFGYLARRYGIRVVGAVIPSVSTKAEPSARQLAKLVDTIRREGVHVIFPESSVDPKLERAIADEAGARVGPGLFADSLGPADGPGGTYLKSMTFDVDQMVKAFRAR